MSAAARGDARAFERVYRVVAPRLAKILGRFGADPATAEDLVQETLFRLYSARQRYRHGESVLAWARTIARRLYVDRLRRGATTEVAQETFTEALSLLRA